MEIRRKLLVKLKEKLFRGCPQIIRRRLLDKGQLYSSNYIARCLNPDHRNYSQAIIDEAIKLVTENAAKMESVRHKLDLLNDPTV
ncbi:MAG: hypothetical protein NTW16_01390 [Bacteroidetes bacterium]|nr:hypothetical protein [Bacteroidota bacterium]